MKILSLVKDVILEHFPEMDLEHVTELVHRAFPTWSATRIYEWIQRCFPKRVGMARQALLARQAIRNFPSLMNHMEIPVYLSRYSQCTHQSADVPNGIIAYVRKEFQENLLGESLVHVTFGSFEGEIHGAGGNAKNVADLAAGSFFCSDYRAEGDDIPDTKNNWVCYDFKDRRVSPTHYAIRTHNANPDQAHLKSWLVKRSTDGEAWLEVGREESNSTAHVLPADLMLRTAESAT
jgi:hypothetical protein